MKQNDDTPDREAIERAAILTAVTIIVAALEKAEKLAMQGNMSEAATGLLQVKKMMEEMSNALGVSVHNRIIDAVDAVIGLDRGAVLNKLNINTDDTTPGPSMN